MTVFAGVQLSNAIETKSKPMPTQQIVFFIFSLSIHLIKK